MLKIPKIVPQLLGEIARESLRPGATKPRLPASAGRVMLDGLAERVSGKSSLPPRIGTAIHELGRLGARAAAEMRGPLRQASSSFVHATPAAYVPILQCLSQHFIDAMMSVIFQKLQALEEELLQASMRFMHQTGDVPTGHHEADTASPAPAPAPAPATKVNVGNQAELVQQLRDRGVDLKQFAKDLRSYMQSGGHSDSIEHYSERLGFDITDASSRKDAAQILLALERENRKVGKPEDAQ